MKPHELEAHEARIASVLARKAMHSGYEAGASVTTYTPLSALLASEEGDREEAQMRAEVIGALIDFVLQRGAHPAHALKNFYALVHALRPGALPHWTCQDFADLFGETKAAHSWRVKQIFRTVKTARPMKARFQKSTAATAVYSDAQKGNRNRRHLPRSAEERRAA